LLSAFGGWAVAIPRGLSTSKVKCADGKLAPTTPDLVAVQLGRRRLSTGSFAMIARKQIMARATNTDEVDLSLRHLVRELDNFGIR